MRLREEILQQPRGTIARITAVSGLSKQTVLLTLHGKRGGQKAARLIAAAYGKPKRWRELLLDLPTSVQPTQSEAA